MGIWSRKVTICDAFPAVDTMSSNIMYRIFVTNMDTRGRT